MDLRTELTYPGASAAAVRSLALDREFRLEVCRATAAVDQAVEVREDDDGSAVVTVRRTLPAAVPDMFKRLVGETIDIVQTERWGPARDGGSYVADLSVQVAGQPAGMTGTLTVTERDGGAVEVVEGDVKVSMPFVGRKFEAELAKGILAATRREEQVGRVWLAR